MSRSTITGLKVASIQARRGGTLSSPEFILPIFGYRRIQTFSRLEAAGRVNKNVGSIHLNSFFVDNDSVQGTASSSK